MIMRRTATDAAGRPIDALPLSGLLDLAERELRAVGVWLFGSRARGTARAESDWDLLVVVPDDSPAADDLLTGWRLQKKAGVPADIVVCRVADFEDARAIPNTLAYEADHFGIPLHER